MSIISGQDSRFQIGLTSSWRTASSPRVRLPFTQEGFKGTPNYKGSEALVGASGDTSMAIMSFKADGSFSSYVTPDVAKLLFYMALGAEDDPTASGVQQKHRFTPMGAGECANLPSATVEIDRLLERALYLNYKIGTWKLSGKAEDYIMFESDGPAFKENIQDVIAHGVVIDYVGGTRVLTLPAGVITANDEFNGKVAKLVESGCGAVVYAKITDTTLASNEILLDATLYGGGSPSAVDDAYNGYTCNIMEWEMNPSIPISAMEYFRFVHGYLYMDGMITPYDALPTGAGSTTYTGTNGDTVVDVPTDVTGAAGHELYVRAVDPEGVTRVYKYTSTISSRTATILTFMDTPVGADKLQSIFTATGTLNSAEWSISEEQYDEVTEFTLSGDNKIGEAVFGMNGSMFSSEVNPTSRSFSLDLSSRFTSRFSKLRRDRMMAGVPMKIRLEFITKIADGPLGEQVTSADSSGLPYKIIVDIQKAYYTEGGANISGPDEPTVSPKFTLAETPGVHKAIEISVYDDVAVKASTATYSALPRDDGYSA